MGRRRDRRQELRRADVGTAKHADFAVRVRQRRGPFDGVVAVVQFVLEGVELALGLITAANVLCDDDVAAGRAAHAELESSGFVVRRSREQHGKFTGGFRAVDVGAQSHAVAHLRGDVPLDHHSVLGCRRFRGRPGELRLSPRDGETDQRDCDCAQRLRTVFSRHASVPLRLAAAGFRSFDECALPSHRLHRSLQSWNFFGWLLALRQSRRAQQLYPRDLNPDDTEFWEALWPAARCFLPQFSGSLANLGSSGLPTAANPNFRNSLEGLEANFAERIRLCS